MGSGNQIVDEIKQGNTDAIILHNQQIALLLEISQNNQQNNQELKNINILLTTLQSTMDKIATNTEKTV